LAVAGCATGPTYRPKGSVDGIGYSDQQITLTRYRVSYAGDSETPLPQVQDYLLRRAAELTVRAGYTHFAFDHRDIESTTNRYTSADTWNPDNGLGFNLGRRYPGRAEHFANFSFPAFWSESEAAQSTRYTASSEIVMLRPDQLAAYPTALSAAEILDRLAHGQTVDASAPPLGQPHP
jgi:hypothetical protein